MKVALFGQTRWTRILAAMLQQHRGEPITAEPLSVRQSVRLLRPGRQPDILLRVGYRPGAPTPRGIAFDQWWSVIRRANPDAIPILYWIGTDLMNTMVDARAGRLRQPFRAATAEMRHIAAAPWFVDDLRQVGINASLVLFPVDLPPLSTPHPLPERFSALTYIPSGRFTHYGGDMIIDAARQLPDVAFAILGSDGAGLTRSAPNNVRFLGWTDNPDAAYAQASVVVRLVSHDALGATVREGLIHARHVVYTYPVPFTERVAYGDTRGLVGVLGGLHLAHQAGRLTLNMPGREYALAEFDPAQHVGRLVEELRAATA
jgi:hypothetical protein